MLVCVSLGLWCVALWWGWCAVGAVHGSTQTPPRYGSSAIAITPDGVTVLAVNPDSNSLSLVDATSLTVLAELAVGVDPRSVAVSPDCSWACTADQGSDSVTLIDITNRTVKQAVLVGDRPVGVAISPGGDCVAVAELGDDRVRLLRPGSWTVHAVYDVGDRPCGLAFTPDGRRLLVSHLLSGEVTILTVRPYAVHMPVVGAIHELPLPSAQELSVTGAQEPMAPQVLGIRGPMQPSSGSLADPLVIPTWMNVGPAPAVVVNATGTRAYLPQSMAHGLGLNTQFDTSIFPKVSVLNLEADAHQTSEHISLPETDQPVGLPWDAALARDGQELWVVNAASNDLSVLDISAPRQPKRKAHLTVGDNPRGVVLHPDGSRAYVNNVLAGTVHVIDAQAYTVTSVVTVTQIPLPPAMLVGKRLYHSSATPELSQARWISCNSCHIEGEHDSRTWLLQYTGQVPLGAQAIITRNTTSLLGMVETYPLRWSAEWDESADSEHSVRFEQFGTGLISGTMHPTLGDPNQGRSWELDCLSLFIDSLQVPERRRNLSEAQRRGQALFNAPETGCLTCHPPPLYTDLRTHDVGTADSYGEWFGPAIDTPTLRFLYDSAPYLHDGSAATLLDVLTTANADDPHGMAGILGPSELDDLVAFLQALPYASAEAGFSYAASGCLSSTTRGPASISIRLEGRDVVMDHRGAMYNCCAQMAVYLEVDGSLIRLTEQEEYPDEGPCRCTCPVDLGARVRELPSGTYVVEVWNGTNDELLLRQTVVVGSG